MWSTKPYVDHKNHGLGRLAFLAILAGKRTTSNDNDDHEQRLLLLMMMMLDATRHWELPWNKEVGATWSRW